MATAWVEHVIDYNWSHVRQSITEGEQAMADAAAPMITIQHVVPDNPVTLGKAAAQYARKGCPDPCRGDGRRHRRADAGDRGDPRAAAGGTEPTASDDGQDEPTSPSVITVGIGKLSARRIEEAAANRADHRNH